MNKSINYRESNGLIIPYLELSSEFKTLRINNIRIGPGNKHELNKSSIEDLIMQYGPGIKIETSGIPLQSI